MYDMYMVGYMVRYTSSVYVMYDMYMMGYMIWDAYYDIHDVWYCCVVKYGQYGKVYIL